MSSSSLRPGYVDPDRPLTRNGTMIMPALDLYRELAGYDEETLREQDPAQHLAAPMDLAGDLAGELTRDLAQELDELSVVLDARGQQVLTAGEDQPTLDHAPVDAVPAPVAPRERVHPQRRMTFAALRALPARVSTLPPPPPGRSALAAAEAATVQAPALAAPRASQPAGSTTVEAIAGMPIIAVGEDFVARSGAAARPSTTVIPPPLPAFAAPVSVPAPRPFQGGVAFADVQRASFSSIAPTSFAIASEDTVMVRRQDKRRGRGRIAAAVGIWVAVAAGVALVATGRLGQTPAPSSPESAPVAAHVAPPADRAPAAAAPAAPAPAAPAIEDEAEAAPSEDAEPVAAAVPAQPVAAVVPASTPASPAKAGAWPTAATPRKDPQIHIDSVFFGHTSDDRSVTMQLDGKTVIVREGDVADDVQVEKIMRDGVILRRGNRKFAVYAQE